MGLLAETHFFYECIITLKKTFMKKLLTALSYLVLAAGCSVEPIGPNASRVEGVYLNETMLELTEGQEFWLLATVEPSNIVDWVSDHPEIVPVSAKGGIFALTPGTATITATTHDGGFKAQCIVTVSEAEVIPDSEISLITTAQGEFSLFAPGKKDCIVDWGDGSAPETFPDNNWEYCFHTYQDGKAEHRVVIRGATTWLMLEEKTNNITSLDVSNSPFLERLSCRWNTLTTLDASKCPVLQELYCAQNALTELDLSDVPMLKTLYCDSNLPLASLDVSTCPALQTLACGDTSISRLDVSMCPELDFLSCSNTLISRLDVSMCPKLRHLACSGPSLEGLDASGCSALEYLDCAESPSMTLLRVKGCTALEVLWCLRSALTELDVSSCTALTELYCPSSHLTRMDVSACTGLKNLNLRDNSLTHLDVSG